MTSHLRNQLMEGRAVLPRVGSVVQLETQHPAYAVLDPDGSPVESVTPYLRDLALNDNSPETSRSYANDLLRWFLPIAAGSPSPSSSTATPSTTRASAGC
ncbi:hypothetical protein ABZ784_24625 [Streptomyces tendae]|uniref:hypothetical protein n=1 Tax=Streptomyces tendae TaxID=1932 RepID=UPI0033F6A245